MRFALIALLAGCVGGGHSTPAWPKQHVAETDGGESLAPRAAAAYAVAASTSEDDKPIIPAVVAPTVTPTATTPTATPATATPGTTDETLQTEDIIIEIDD